MPRLLKYTLTFSFLFFFGFASSSLLSQFTQETRNSLILEGVKNNSTIVQEKHLRPLVATIQGPEVFPNDPEEVVTLKATIRTSNADFSSVKYEWILPDDVEVVKGYVSSDIASPVANQNYEAEIIVKGFNSLDRKDISIIVSTLDKQGLKIGNSAVITSRPEDSMEHLAPLMMVKAQEFKASQSKKRVPASEDDK